MLLFNIFVICCAPVLVYGASEEASTPAPPPPDIQIKRYEACKDIVTPAKFSTVINKKTPTVFLITGEGSSPYDLGENIMIHFIAESFDNGQWNTVLKMDEKDPCQLLNDYIGQTWYDIEKLINIPVGKCPIPKGTYSIKDYEFDLEKIVSASSIPKGQVRIQANATQGDELVLCIEAELESK